MTKAHRRTVICRVIAVLLAAWSALLALDGPTIEGSSSSNTTYECSPPISYVLSDDARYYWLDPGEVPDWVAAECRSRRIGAAVTIGLFGNIVALLLGFARRPAPPVEQPLPPLPSKPPPQPVRPDEDEDGLWNPGLRQERLRKQQPPGEVSG
ncbi:hypothetical protein [Actinoplanes italicus]|uniref:hypothetical protein n=1 Tax=Actinoplanes italicus TaxID=113567 RepID=UPI0011B26DD8|nr:hypothetical protein [Actinoplanes italicus]